MGLHPLIRAKRSSFAPSTDSQSQSLFTTRPFAPPEPEATEAETDASRQTQANRSTLPVLTPINIPLFSPDSAAASATPSAAIQRQGSAELDKGDEDNVPMQAKLAIGKPDDPYEQEADRVASEVVNQISAPPSSSIQRMDNLEEEEIQTKSVAGSLVQRMDNLEEEEIQTKPLTGAIAPSIQRMDNLEEEEIQTKPLTGAIAPSIQRMDNLEEEEIQAKPLTGAIAPVVQRMDNLEEEEIQTKPLAGAIAPLVQREEMKDEDLRMMPVQRVVEVGGMEASPDLESSIAQARGGGQPLDQSIREPIEQAMKADFSGVKVHTDTQADQLNRSVQAKAFTTGQDVFFRQGEYNPGSRGGQELIAHELTHVVQQNGRAVQRSPLPQQQLAQHSAKIPLNFRSLTEKQLLQRITHTVPPNPTVVINIATLNDDDCRLHLQRIGRINAGRPQGNDHEYHYDPGDRDAIRAQQVALREARRAAFVNALVAQLAALGSAVAHAVNPPWHGQHPVGVEGDEVVGVNVQPVEATIVGEWTAFLGAGPYSHIHPRTGLVDNTRLVSHDGQRSIRYGNHERNSSANLHHFHQETWVYDVDANTVTVNNTLRRAPVQ